MAANQEPRKLTVGSVRAFRAGIGCSFDEHEGKSVDGPGGIRIEFDVTALRGGFAPSRDGSCSRWLLDPRDVGLLLPTLDDGLCGGHFLAARDMLGACTTLWWMTRGWKDPPRFRYMRTVISVTSGGSMSVVTAWMARSRLHNNLVLSWECRCGSRAKLQGLGVCLRAISTWSSQLLVMFIDFSHRDG